MNLLLMIFAAVVVAFILAYVIVKFVPLKMRWLISLLLLGASVFLGWKIYGGIMEPIKFNIEKQKRYTKVIEKLKVIRDAEIKYSEVNGKFTANKDSLVNFINTGKLALTKTYNVQQTVNIGGGLTKEVSVRKVDTIGYEPVSKYFEGKDLSTLFKAPGTDKDFVFKTGEIEKVPGLFVPVFEVSIDKASVLNGMNAMLVKGELKAIEADQIKGENIAVGSLNEVTTGGNWPPSYDKADAVAKKK